MVVNDQAFWFLARSSGLVAAALLTATVLGGILLAGRLAGRRPGPAWVLDLHRGAAALSLWFTAVHLGALVADSYVDFGLRELLVPMASTWRPGAVAAGVVAMWLLAVVQGTSLIRKRTILGWQLSNRVWRRLHWLSYLAWLAVVGHTLAAGSDAFTPQVLTLGAGAVAAVVTYAVVRWTTRPARRGPPRAREEPAIPRAKIG